MSAARLSSSRRGSALLVAAAILACAAPTARASIIAGDPWMSNLPAGITMTISGAALGTYDGEGHVVGPIGADGKPHPYTLTDLNGGHPFLTNSGADRITIKLSAPIYSLSFDYEIFPNGDMADGRNKNPLTTPNWPDFTFTADGVTVFRTLATKPEDLPFAYSPASFAAGHLETAPQFIGSSGVLLFPQGVQTLEFIDWPPTIGITNLNFTTPGPNIAPPPATIPEPPSAWILTTGLLSVLLASVLLKRSPAMKGVAV